MDIVYTLQDAPETLTSSVFLAGPTPRDPDTPSWRLEALKLLEELGYDGVVFVPEYEGGWSTDCKYNEQVEWEERYLTMADAILFWVPRDIGGGLPAFTTNIEWGKWQTSGKCVLGSPPDADGMRYLIEDAERLHIPYRTSLLETLGAAVGRLGGGEERTGGERFVPLHIWKLTAFDGWYKAQKAAGNRLDHARLLWRFGVGPGKLFTFCFALHVNMYIAAEDRHKTNEFILGRPDISVVVAYKAPPEPDLRSGWHESGASGDFNMLDAEIVLIREFRSPAVTEDGFLHELPGGSTFQIGKDPLELASDEFREETGFGAELTRFKYLGRRQVAGTLSTYKAHLFTLEMGAEEIKKLKQEVNVAHGVAGDSERTFVEIHRVGDLLASDQVDWSNMGMILTALLESQ